jgi:GTP1/Obg family GTP-binding protein
MPREAMMREAMKPLTATELINKALKRLGRSSDLTTKAAHETDLNKCRKLMRRIEQEAIQAVKDRIDGK